MTPVTILKKVRNQVRARTNLANRLKNEVQLRHDRAYQQNHRRMDQFANRHRGERCFIIGNGPSLNKTPLEELSGYVCFGLNRINLLFDSRQWRPDYHVCVNPLVLEQCSEDFKTLEMPRFSPWRHKGLFQDDPNAFFIQDNLTRPYFARSLNHMLWQGGTVTYVALQIAYAMGFSSVVLVGVDHSFATKGPANKEVVSQGSDPNHFHPNYFGKGFTWNLPDLDLSERAYGLARFMYERDGREIIDATIGGKLQIFKKAKLSKILEEDLP